jgi:hypothetical protein
MAGSQEFRLKRAFSHASPTYVGVRLPRAKAGAANTVLEIS